MRTQSPNEHGRSPRAEEEDDVDLSENEQLRAEIKRLQSSLAQKYRGSSKLVGASQFRSGKATNATMGCVSCSNLKNALKKARAELKELEPYTDEIQYKLSDMKMKHKQLDDMYGASQSQLEEAQKTIAELQTQLREGA